MADEPKKENSEDIESILTDLDAILTDMGGNAQAATPAPQAPPPPAPKAPPEIPAPQVVVDSPKAAPEVPAPKAPPKIELGPQIELSPREGMIKPADKIPEPPKPAPKLPEQKSVELSAVPAPQAPQVVVDSPQANQPPPPPPKPAEPPKAKEPEAPKSPTAVPAPVPVVASTKPEELPESTPKEQIRRVAYIYTATSAEMKGLFAAFLSQAARTISKKPLFLREVLAHEVGAASDPNALVQKAIQVKAVAVLAVVDGWPPTKVDELSEACSRTNLLFRSVAPVDAQKKSTAVDIIVDMMLLPGES